MSADLGSFAEKCIKMKDVAECCFTQLYGEIVRSLVQLCGCVMELCG